MNSRIQTRTETRLRRQQKECRTFELKINSDKLNHQQREHLKRTFLEAKWLYNSCIATEDKTQINTKTTEVQIKVKEEFEQRKLDHLSSQMKQSVIQEIWDALKGLKVKKDHGYKAGRLKFKHQVDSITLKQYGVTYKLDLNNDTIKIQGMKKLLKVHGMPQLKELNNPEFACAKLIKRDSNYYLHITVYTDPIPLNPAHFAVGTDFGCDKQLTLSNGVALEYQVRPTHKLKKIQRKMCKRRRNEHKSKNYLKQLIKYRKEHRTLTNQRKDIHNKIINILERFFKYIGIQNDSIKGWMYRSGKKITNTAIGKIKQCLRTKPTTVEVDRFFPSTQMCDECGMLNKIELSQRVYECPCGNKKHRDYHSAICVLKQVLAQLGTEYTKVKDACGDESSTLKMLDLFNQIPHLKATLVA